MQNTYKKHRIALLYCIVPERINTRAYVKVSTHVIIMAKANTNYMENADIQEIRLFNHNANR